MSERYNFTEIEKFTGKDPFALQEMIKIFLKSVPETLAEINKSFESDDLEKFQYFSHKLKSSIDLLSIWELKNEIRLMEKCSGEDFKTQKITDLVEILNRTLNDLLPEIEKEINF